MNLIARVMIKAARNFLMVLLYLLRVELKENDSKLIT